MVCVGGKVFGEILKAQRLRGFQINEVAVQRRRLILINSLTLVSDLAPST